MKRILAILVISIASAWSQPPRAVPLEEPALRPDPGADFFERGKNLYDAAVATSDLPMRQELYSRAIGVFTDYLKDFGRHANAERAWWYLGNSFKQVGQANDAKRCFSALLTSGGKGMWVAAAAYTMAADYYNRGDYALAAPLFERYAVNALKPDERPKGYYFAGNCYRQLGRDVEARQALQQVVNDPEGGAYAPQAKLALAHLLVKAGKLDVAYQQFEELVAAPYPDKLRGEAALQAGIVANSLHKPEDAERYLKLVLLNPEMGDFWSDAQTALMAGHLKNKEYRKVIEVFGSSTVKAEGEKEAARLMFAARAYMQLKDPANATVLFRDVERLVAPSSDLAFEASYLRLMCFYQIEGRYLPEQVDAFLQLYHQSRQGDSRIHTALMMKAETLYASGKVSEAAGVYNEIQASLVSDQNRPGLLYQRGWCLAEAGDSLGAIKSLSQFIKEYSKDSRYASALAKRAKLYADSGKGSNALEDFDRLIALGKPAELISYAWLESARMKRNENQIPEMISRYNGLLKLENINEAHQAEAHYWMGWGMVKTNAIKESIGHLEKARTLRPDAYSKHAGILLALGYFSTQDVSQLVLEVNRAIEGKYHGDLPNQALQWIGMQSYNASEYAQAAKFLNLMATPKEPRATPKEVWRYLAKSQLQIGQNQAALDAVLHVLEVEENLGWKADGMLDQAKALYALERNVDSKKIVDDAMAMQPQGRTSAGLRILAGDLEMRAGNAKKASAEYLIVVGFLNDPELKPLALSKLGQSFEAQNDLAEAEKYRQQLKSEFPDWKAP